MATKIVFIAACVLAVTANAVRVVQDQDDGYEHQNTDYGHQKTDYEPKKTDYEPKKTDYEPKKTDYEPKKTDYEPRKTEYEPKNIDYQPKRVICVGVDVTNDCVYRADGNYAIDSEPRSGYVACVNKRAICMPCPYGLVFCAKAGYRGLGQCLGKYDECPPRPY